jgi:hypothetical protein
LPLPRSLGSSRVFRDWLEAFDSYRAQAEAFVEVGDRVVVGYRVTGRGKGSGVDVEMLRWKRTAADREEDQ